MEKYLETTGRTEELAIESALQKLGLERDDVSVEVLERPRSGFLGIGGTPAKVRITYEAAEEVSIVVEKERPAKPAVTEAVERTAPSLGTVSQTAVEDGDDRAEKIYSFLTGLMAHMNVTATPKIALGAADTYEVELVGETLGILIGHRGETLDAIQQLTSYAANHGEARRIRVHVDAEHYRSKREESLERLAVKVAGKVLKFHRNVTLEPMNAYERHVIHTALQDHPGVSTYSMGTEPNRRIVVAYGKTQQTEKTR